MYPELYALATEALARLEGRPAHHGAPQFLASDGLHCLLRTDEGLKVVPPQALPQRLDLAHLLDHTLLQATAQAQGIELLCQEALAYGFASVCVNPTWVTRCSNRLVGSPIRVCTVIGFPLGGNTLTNKTREAEEALANGSQEIDFVMALGSAKVGDWASVGAEFKALRRITGSVCLKVILETCLLEEEEKLRACVLARDQGLDFVKTSTGFSSGGATLEDVSLMRQTVGTACGVKASGGIRTRERALQMLLAGATRLGVSASLQLVLPSPESAQWGPNSISSCSRRSSNSSRRSSVASRGIPRARSSSWLTKTVSRSLQPAMSAASMPPASRP